jgi:hypothetical protein
VIVLDVMCSLVIGLIISVIFKKLVNIGLHHMVHCIESMLMILSIILFVTDKCYWYVLIVSSTIMWRQLFRVICDCSDILKDKKAK